MLGPDFVYCVQMVQSGKFGMKMGGVQGASASIVCETLCTCLSELLESTFVLIQRLLVDDHQAIV